MALPTRDPIPTYLFGRASLLRRERGVASGAAEHLEAHAHALELLAELVRSLPADDERLLMLGTLAVREGQFTPGAATEHALNQFDGASREACDGFLTNLVRIARDDAFARAREQGHLPPVGPR